MSDQEIRDQERAADESPSDFVLRMAWARSAARAGDERGKAFVELVRRAERWFRVTARGRRVAATTTETAEELELVTLVGHRLSSAFVQRARAFRRAWLVARRLGVAQRGRFAHPPNRMLTSHHGDPYIECERSQGEMLEWCLAEGDSSPACVRCGRPVSGRFPDRLCSKCEGSARVIYE